MYIAKSLRMEQWVKNLLIFAPIIFAKQIEVNKLLDLIYCFFGFSLVVSSTYIINDLVDSESDKNHPTKKFRPIASGVLDKRIWLVISFTSFLIGMFILYNIRISTVYYPLTYCFITFSYSFLLKYKKFLDILSIAILFSIRVLLGGDVAEIAVSTELGLFVFFTSLGIVSSKKYSILINENIKNSKIKQFLNNKYSSTELKNIVKLSFVTSTFVYFAWIVKDINFEYISNTILNFASLFFLIVFKFKFYTETKNGDSEDIFNLLRRDKALFLLGLMFSLSSLILSI
tara:strand:+ start:1154 stop:2014 length:861 start_codon:yes stop_codon:yes gene_type:complete